MDKLTLNNQIVSMRATVRKVRLHVVRKLCREREKLLGYKGEQVEKLKEKKTRKADRLRDEILCMKSINENDVSKFALLNQRSLKDILTDVSLPVETRAKARMATHKAMVERVESFRSVFPDWEIKLAPMLAQLGLQYRHKRKKGKVQKCLQSKGKAGRFSEDGAEEDIYVSRYPSYVEPEVEVNVAFDNSAIGSEDTTVDTFENDSPANTNVDDLSPLRKDEIENEMKAEIRVEQTFRKISNDSEVRKFTDLLDRVDSAFSAMNGAPKSVDETNIKEQNVASDSFFMQGDEAGGNSEVKSFPTNRITERRSEFRGSNVKFQKQDWQHSNTRLPFKQLPHRDSFSTAARDTDTFAIKLPNRYENVRERRDFTKSSNSNYKSTNNVAINRKQRRFLERTSKLEPEPKKEVLHPSWEAKRKMKQNLIVEFQGKKIKFDD